ncbi:hypothetical protein, conserved [Eimeria brunetti]|uniref:Uncharacterized protein n=1 Tax=Eimeria brunetti TaxID=51314 RepID=U6LIW0_9EIME|nr:hypothetical protein, conserved [Eimeria brunetti]
MRALRRCVLQALSYRWAWGPPRPVGAPWGAPWGAPLPAGAPPGPPGGPTGGPPGPPGLQGAPQEWGALQWAQQQKETFPSGYQVLLEERASCAAANIWNAIQDTEEKLKEGGPPEGTGAEGALGRGPTGGAPYQGKAISSWAHSSIHRGDPPAAIARELRVPIDGGPIGGPPKGPPEWGPFKRALEWGPPATAGGSSGIRGPP